MKQLLIEILNGVNINRKKKINKDYKNCFISNENSNKKIIHIIITPFMIEFIKRNGFDKILYKKEYIENGIRVMKKYLFPSLKYQICKDFIWMLSLGEKANITYIKSLLNFKMPFKFIILYFKDMRNFIRNITKKADILITTRMDYDDRIYFDAVNDVRKKVNVSKPIFLHGYHRGFYYYEKFNIYTEFYRHYNNQGAIGIFESLIIVLNKVKDSYYIYDLGAHTLIRATLLKKYKKFGLKKLDYEPAFFEKDTPKFVYVRQHYSVFYRFYMKPKGKIVNFDLNKFYGIKK